MTKYFLLMMAVLACVNPALAVAKTGATFDQQMAQLEAKYNGRIGVDMWNTAKDTRLSYRGDERFVMCSTHKFPLVAAVLARVDAGQDTLTRQISYGPADLLPHAPIAKKHVAEEKLSVADLSAAALQYSDNTASNLLLHAIGGPEGFTNYVRGLGDNITRLDRNEPDLNTNLPGDDRDTTTPAAMTDLLHKILLGDALTPTSREQLIKWMAGNTTGDKRIRAGVPDGWRVGDKTGTGDNGATSDIAILWPPNGGKPVLLSIYYSGAERDMETRHKIIAEVTQVITFLHLD